MIQHWMLLIQQWVEIYLCDATLVAMETGTDIGEAPP